MASRSLGTLTIDLIAKIGGFKEGFERAQKTAKTGASNIKKELATLKDPIMNMGKWFTASAAVAAAGLAVMAVRSGDMAREIKAQAQAANTSVEALQAQGFAVNTVGIQMDQYADILKDVNDRFGEFLSTGSGPMIDFFQNVAPKIGITADAFRDLSGPDALQLFVTSMEKAGLSQQQMTFYMEALSSNSTLLLPLLRDNGKAMRALTEDAYELGVVVSDVQIENLVTMANKFNQAKQAFEATQLEFIANLGAADLSSAVDSLNDLRDVVTDPDFAEGVVSLVEGMANAAGWAAKLATWFGKFAQDFRHAILRDQGLTTMSQDLADAIETMEGLVNGSDLMGPNGLRVDIELPTGEILKAGATVDDLTKRLEELQAIGKRWSDNPVVLPTVTVEPPDIPSHPQGPSQNAAERAAAAAAAAEQARKYDAMLKAIMSDEEKVRDTIKARVDILNAASVEADKYDKILGKIVKKSIEAVPKFGGIDAAVGGPAGELVKVAEADKKLQEWHDKQVERYNDLAEQKLITEQAAADAITEIDKQSAEQRKSIHLGYTSAVLATTSAMTGQVASMMAEMGDKSSTAYKVMFAISKAASIAQAIVNTEVAATKAMTISPFLGAVVRGLGYASVGVIASQTIAGMAHDGIDSVPKEGTWLLDRGERVVDRRTNQDLKQFLSSQTTNNSVSGGNVSVVVNIDQGGATQTQAPTGYESMAQEIARVAKQHTKQTIATEMRPGGMLYKAGGARG